VTTAVWSLPTNVSAIWGDDPEPVQPGESNCAALLTSMVSADDGPNQIGFCSSASCQTACQMAWNGNSSCNFSNQSSVQCYSHSDCSVGNGCNHHGAQFTCSSSQVHVYGLCWCGNSDPLPGG
jgi:hypothetical protein